MSTAVSAGDRVHILTSRLVLFDDTSSLPSFTVIFSSTVNLQERNTMDQNAQASNARSKKRREETSEEYCPPFRGFFVHTASPKKRMVTQAEKVTQDTAMTTQCQHHSPDEPHLDTPRPDVVGKVPLFTFRFPALYSEEDEEAYQLDDTIVYAEADSTTMEPTAPCCTNYIFDDDPDGTLTEFLTEGSEYMMAKRTPSADFEKWLVNLYFEGETMEDLECGSKWYILDYEDTDVFAEGLPWKDDRRPHGWTHSCIQVNHFTTFQRCVTIS